MIAWRDGIEHVDGAPVRELVQPNVWTSSVWISRDGAAFRKYFNTQTRQWSAWEDVPFSLDHEMQTRLGVDVGGWKSVATAVATAWCYRAPNSRAYATMRGGDPSTVAWGEPRSSTPRREIFTARRGSRCGGAAAPSTATLAMKSRRTGGSGIRGVR